MRANRSRDTGPERAIRSALHARGLRYQLHRRAVRDVRSEADLLFPKERVAVYVDGCFWHSCPQHRVLPKANAAWWKSKLQANVDRDRRVDTALARARLDSRQDLGTRTSRARSRLDRGRGPRTTRQLTKPGAARR